jgi:hypothetical protein
MKLNDTSINHAIDAGQRKHLPGLSRLPAAFEALD